MRLMYAREADPASLLTPPIQVGSEIEARVDEILARVQKEGDAALIDCARRFDRAELTSVLVSEAEIEEAFAQVDPSLLRAIEQSRDNITAFHARQKREGFVMSGAKGSLMGQRVLPLRRVGLYVPGGTAAYPSTVLMNAIPAQLAGVEEIVMTTPPGADGKVRPVILAAARLAGVTKIVKAGGAQAIAALAWGTESVPRVDKIVGPGNAYVATAKRKVFGQVAIDMIAGPSEILVVADAGSNPRNIAADLLSQAEHDVLASAILLTDCEELGRAVIDEVDRQLALLPRQDIAARSINDNGKVIIVDNLHEAVEISNRIAPEHLELCVEDPFALLGEVRNAGSVFMGRWAPEALGDYWAGPNHTLPTSGTARFSSPLSVDDFVKKSSFIYYTQEALAAAKNDIARFAASEGLDAHARSVTIRFEEEEA